MYMPLLAAGAVAALIASAPMMTPQLLQAADAADMFQPLICAMANSGSCHMTHKFIDPARNQHPQPHRSMLAAAIE